MCSISKNGKDVLFGGMVWNRSYWDWLRLGCIVGIAQLVGKMVRMSHAFDRDDGILADLSSAARAGLW